GGGFRTTSRRLPMLRLRRWCTLVWPLIACAMAIVLGGCFDRKEHITISERGSAAFELNYHTDSLDDLLNGDVMPTPQAGWAVEQKSEKDKDGKESFSLLALASYPPGFAMPSNF